MQDQKKYIDEVFELFIELGADDDQLDFPIIYASAREGFARYNVEDINNDMIPLFDTIIENVECSKGRIRWTIPNAYYYFRY